MGLKLPRMIMLQIGIIKLRFHYFVNQRPSCPRFRICLLRRQAPKPTSYIFGDTRTPEKQTKKFRAHFGKSCFRKSENPELRKKKLFFSKTYHISSDNSSILLLVVNGSSLKAHGGLRDLTANFWLATSHEPWSMSHEPWAMNHQ